MYILTSSSHKIKEYEEFGLVAKRGPDVAEVLGTIDEVIAYKILGAGPFVLVEDTVLEVGGEVIVDSKYKLKQILKDGNAAWITSLGYHDNTTLYVYRGRVDGEIVTPVTEHESSFEPRFIPLGAGMTLHELKEKGLKQHYSARRLAVEAYQGNRPIFTRQVNEVPVWKGEYQKK